MMNRKQRRAAGKRGQPRDSSTAPDTAALALAGEHLRSGQPAAAEAVCQRILETDPAQPDALNMLGRIALGRNDAERAVSLLQDALRHRPDTTDARYNLGTAFLRLGRHEEAAANLRRAAELSPDFAAAHLNLGNALRELGRTGEAAKAYRQALSAKPDYPQARLNLGSTLVELGEPAAAEACYRDALARHPDFVPVLLNLSQLLRGKGDLDEAATLLRRTLEIEPGSSEAHNTLGNVYRDMGRLDEARRSYRAAIAAQPDNARAHANFAYLTTHAPNDPHVTEMEELLGREGIDAESAIHFRFGLAKAYEEWGDYARSFENLRVANRDRRATLGTGAGTEADAAKLTDTLIERFERAFLDANRDRACDSELAVFIVGMPRSGTSLVEQILASHPEVHGAGELTDLFEVLAGVEGRPPTPDELQDAMERFDPAGAAQLGARYVERLAARAPGARRITDKMPSNFVNLGIIGLALPRAAIIHCVRNPMDTCLSCYKVDFNQGQTFYNDLTELGHTYRLYAKLMDHWESVMPGRILHVGYERMIADQEGETRRLLAHCGLDWDARVLDFHKTERPVRTASAAQVREPIFAASVARWKRFEAELAPLIEALGPDAGDAGERWPLTRAAR